MYIIDLSNRLEESDGVHSAITDVARLCSDIYNRMDSSDTLWIFATNHYGRDSFVPVSMKLTGEIGDVTDFSLRDIITVHNKDKSSNLFRNSYEEILLLVKNEETYAFYKDDIRVKPVYKGNEWNGHRENGRSSYRDRTTKRYNSSGKDPGNVWLEEIRTDTQNSVLDRTRPLLRSEAIRRCIRAGSIEGEKVHTYWPTNEMIEIIHSEGRVVSNLPASQS